MEVIRGFHNLKARHQASVLTIGNFDAVHLGHQAVLRQVVKKARELGLRASVMIFEPQPREYFARLAGQSAPARLSNFREKYHLLAKLGIDQLLVINFNADLAKLSKEAFVELLHQKMGVRCLIVGDDFRFGIKQQGDFSYLKKHANFAVISTESFKVKLNTPIRVSSTAIRQALAKANFQQAKMLLGRDFSLSGRVAHGQKLGRTLDFPTANIALKRLCAPLQGVYAVRVYGLADKPINGVANIGIRPTVNGDKARLEVHLFNFEQNIYGKQIEVRFCIKLRNEQKFDSLSALKQQIEYDAKAASTWLDNN